MLKQPRMNEHERTQKKQELFASFRHRDDFRVDRLARGHRLSKASSADVLQKFYPIEAKYLVSKYKKDGSNEKVDFLEEDFRCPLSQELFHEDPVVLNGHVYERDALEDWIFQSDWLDPLYLLQKVESKEQDDQVSQDAIYDNQVSPEDI